VRRTAPGRREFGPRRAADRALPDVRLDSAMVLARYFPDSPGRDWVLERSDRILYGTDFPILPYRYDRERRCILSLGLGAGAEEAIFWGKRGRLLRPGTTRYCRMTCWRVRTREGAHGIGCKVGG